MLETITRSVIPRAGGHNVFEVGEVNWLHGSTFQQILVPQPIKLGGLGIRSLVETSPAAFVGGVEMSLPHFTGQRAICPLLQEVVGTLDGDSRWVTFLANESRTSGEFKDSWDSLTREAREFSTYLGETLEGPLSQEVEKAGDVSVDGSTRRKIVQQKELLRHKVLSKALQDHPDRQFRPATVFPNFDKLSGAWLLALPGSSTGLSSPVFAEAM